MDDSYFEPNKIEMAQERGKWLKNAKFSRTYLASQMQLPYMIKL